MKLKIEIEGKILFKLLIISLSFKFSILFFFFCWETFEKRFWKRLNKSKNQNQNWTVEKSLEFGYLIFILFFFD